VIIGIVKEIIEGENRVAITPDVAAKLIKKGFSVMIEEDAGLNSGFENEKYIAAGVRLVPDPIELYKESEIVLKVGRPIIHPNYGKSELELMKPGTILISFVYSLHYPEIAKKAAECKINLIAMDAIPRTTIAQRMDALSSQANLAGYKSVILAANYLKKIFPLMMTASGTISPAKIVIMGAGVAGLSALGTAKRLGAVVEVSDIRPSAKEEVQSLGGKFIEVPVDENMQDEKGYAKEASEEFLKKQKDLIFKHITEADIVITTALVPGRKSPLLVTEEMVKNMKQGSVVLDMAVEFGGNCEISEAGKIISKFGKTIIGEGNLPSLVPYHASEMYSKNLQNLLEYVSKDGIFNFNMEDEIISQAAIVKDGVIVHEKTKSILTK